MTKVQRWALCVRYDGSAYHGFQFQHNDLPTIQHALEKALTCVANHSVGITCAGRTDAGVHASGQIIHFDSTAERDVESWVLGTNSNLPHDISVVWAKPVPQDFHARYEARARTYRYVIYNEKVRHSVLRRAITWHYYPLDIERMQQAANVFLGEHDFSSFRASTCQAKNAVRSIDVFNVKPYLNFIVIEIKANAFLQHMVRNLVGTLLPIASGLRPVAWAEEVLAACDRTVAGATAAPNGLYLVQVAYDPKWALPATPCGPIFLPEHW